MANKLKETSLIDMRIKMGFNFALIIFTLYVILYFDANFVLQSNLFYRIIIVIVSLFIANWPFILFIKGVKLDKGWILSIMCIENGNIIPKSKMTSVYNSSGTLWCAVSIVLFMAPNDLRTFYLNFYVGAITLLIYFTSRMLTRVMGYYIYWIARVNNDPKLKTNAPDNIIIECSLESANINYRAAGLLKVILFFSLFVYAFAECFFPLTSSIRIVFAMYSVLVFLWITLFIFLGQLYDNNAVLLNVLRAEYLGDQYAVIKSSLQKRLFNIKFLFTLFVFMEIILFYIVTKMFFNMYIQI